LNREIYATSTVFDLHSIVQVAILFWTPLPWLCTCHPLPVARLLICAVYFALPIMQSYNWMHTPPGRPVDIKIEPPQSESTFSLLSPPSSPSFTRSVPNFPSVNISAPLRRRSNTTIASPRRVRPYPSLTHEHRFRGEDSGKMAHSSFGNWSSRTGRSLNPGERRSSDGDQLNPYALSQPYESVSHLCLSFLFSAWFISDLMG
jgi:hypothetical protein